MRVETSQPHQEMHTPTMSTAFKGHSPSEIAAIDDEYDYSVNTPLSPEEKAFQEYKQRGEPPPPPPPRPPLEKELRTESEDALLDLAQLEELHQEAERMKALGNKHMAAQEYTRAYNAYSAALQLSPVGPSSHVFLSNRAAALLSLKRYAAAATDSRRAVALAPTFGKAHARLGQSLYFLKDYEGAVAAYEQAVHYEPDNKVTETYLQKARTKLAKQQAKYGQDNQSVADTATLANSIATDPHAEAAVVTSGGFRGSSKQIMRAVASSPEQYEQKSPSREAREREMQVVDVPGRSQNLSQPAHQQIVDGTPQDDPDFDEAVRIQQRASRFLAAKNYKHAIEEYSAALFLVPDDPFLSPELHLGRAHALNGSRRHESARNDSLLAIKLRPTPEAYSTLAKSSFYLKDYRGCIDSFDECMALLPDGVTLSHFDQAYYDKAEKALEIEDPDDDGRSVGSRSLRSIKSVVPKLPPPRFVPREQAINQSPNIPPPPRTWPQQSPRQPTALQVGVERPIIFLSEALGIKLNRGSDGVVRVMSVTPDTPGSPIIRTGYIQVGDVIREAAGVDIRRPITNIMWGDTVALIKMAPRPITVIVARELSSIPLTVKDERKRIQSSSVSPSSKQREARPPGSITTSTGEI